MLSNCLLNLIFILSTVIGCLIYYYKRKYEYWQRLGVPSIGISGDTQFQAGKHRAHALQDRYNELAPHPYGGIYEVTKPVLLIRDPQLVRAVMVKDFSHFTDRGMIFDETLDPLSVHIFNLGGKRWKNIRTKLVPTFSSGKLRAMFPIMDECISVLDGYLNDKLKSCDEIEVRELMLKFAMDVIGTCAFGLNCNAILDQNSEFRRIQRRMLPSPLKLKARQVLRSIHPKINSWLRWKGFRQETEDFFLNITKETIKYREENIDKRNDFMQLMINLQHEERKNLQNDAELLFSDHVVAAQVFVFFLAGFETIASTLSTCLYELALNPDIAEKLHAEVKQVLDANGGKLDYEALKKMRYMECIIEETLRKYPPLGMLDRICTEAYELPGSSLIIKENTNVVIPVHALHFDPQYFPEPHKFDPDRFNDENKPKIIPGTYLPFGDGPRICIGMRFAMMEVRSALALIMKNYTVHPTAKTQIPFMYDKDGVVARPAKGVHLRFQKRQS